MLKEIEESKRKILLFIDEIHLVVGAGKTEGAMDAANLLKVRKWITLHSGTSQHSN